MSSKETGAEKLGKARAVGVCLVSDFFYPSVGGVELHIYHIGTQLLNRGFHVIVITHCEIGAQPRHGVRYLTGGLKVYYLPHIVVYENVALPILLGTFPVIRKILIRESIDIVHGHQATSALGIESIWHARVLGLHTVYTDHSLFGFERRGEIHINKVMSLFLCDVDHYICVSNTNHENLVLRGGFLPANGSVIPNAIEMSFFFPDTKRRPPPPEINIVLISRLAYRKGIDLLVDVIPTICRQVSNVHFIIGGDGPKRVRLEEMREKYRLHDRVEMLGTVPHAEVPSVLQRGHIFVNASLTEAFCTSIIEAAACGLLVVATDVGGVHEVLPPHIMKLAKPNDKSLVEEILKALELLQNFDPWATHYEVSKMYSWEDVARRTENVYKLALQRPIPTAAEWSYRICLAGRISGIIISFLSLFEQFLNLVMNLLQPRDEIALCPRWPSHLLRNFHTTEATNHKMSFQ